MKVLAIDSSGLTAAVAVVEETKTIAEYTVNHKKTHSQTLLPMIDEIIKMIGMDLQTIDAIAIAGGPGSFTGLRIGSATAKGLGLALEKPLIHVPTLDGLAYSVYGCRDIICPIMDARRNQVYTGLYTFSCTEETKETKDEKRIEPVFRVLCGQVAVSVEELIQTLNKMERTVVFLGDGVPVYEAVLDERLEVPHCYAPAYMNRQRAAVVGTLGIHYYKEGKYSTAMEQKPEYLRMSQAERERLQRERNTKVTIEDMKLEEAATAAQIEEQCFTDPWSERAIQETLKNPETICLTAKRAGRVIGFLLVYSAADEAEIARIGVLADARRQGVATALLKELEAICFRKKIDRILLDVRKGNSAARIFYKKYGFHEDGVRRDFYGSPKEDAVLMSCMLEEVSGSCI